jgi:hypothetical protein
LGEIGTLIFLTGINRQDKCQSENGQYQRFHNQDSVTQNLTKKDLTIP